MEEEVFRDSKDPLKLKVYNERILPYLDRPEYKVIVKLPLTYNMKCNLLIYYLRHIYVKKTNVYVIISMPVFSWIFVTS